jgi:YVTN family beta-propeller protein
MAAGHGGQILVSRTTRDLVREELPEGTSLRDLGEKRLKDLDDPIQLFQVVAPGLAVQFPRLRTAPPRKRDRVLRPYVAGPVLVVAAAAVAGAVLLTGESAGVTVAANSLGVIDAKTNKVVGQVPVGIGPRSVALGFGSAWVGNEADQSISRVDARTRGRQHTIALGATPTGLAVARAPAGKAGLWVAEGGARALVRVSPLDTIAEKHEEVVPFTRVSGGARGSVATGDGFVWAAYGSSDVIRVSPGATRVRRVGSAGFGASGIAYADHMLWVANNGADNVWRYNVGADARLPAVNVGSQPSGVAVGGGSVWVSDEGSDLVSRIPMGEGGVGATHVGRSPAAVAYGAGSVWVANSGDGTVSRIDPVSGDVVKTIRVGGRPVGLAVGDGLVWVAVQAPLPT